MCGRCGHVSPRAQSWDDGTGSSTELRLGTIYEDAQANLLALFTSAPDFIEPYESVDAHGASIRRFAVLSSPPCGGVSVPEEPAPANSDQVDNKPLSRPPVVGKSNADDHSKAAPRPAPALGAALEKEVAYMRRRFGTAVIIQHQSASLRAGWETPGITFRVDMHPADPEWPGAAPAGALMVLEGAVSHAYPAPGSVSLAVAESMPLPQQVRLLLTAALQREALRLEGRVDALRTLLR